MSMLTANHMKKIARQKQIRKDELQRLTAIPFDMSNEDQMRKFQQRLDHFELSVNRLRVMQSMAELMKVWGGSWIWAVILPIPETVKLALNYTLYLGVTGMVLTHFNVNDFHDEVEEMRQLYNWALKGGQTSYDGSYQNDEILKYPDVQRMISLLAPLCSQEFMVAWPKVIEGEPSQQWSITRAYRWGASWFSTAQPLSNNAEAKLRSIKEKVERGEFNIGILEGLKQAMEYFATDPHFRHLVTEEALNWAQEPLNMVRNALPVIISNTRPAPQ